MSPTFLTSNPGSPPGGLSDGDARRFFFAAAREAELYDAVTPLTLAKYDELHQTVVHFLVQNLRARGVDQPRVLDAGCGTGIGALKILEAVPGARVTCVDLCRPMLNVFRDKLDRHPAGGVRGRCELVERDILDPSIDANELLRVAPGGPGRGRYDAVVSVLMLHHYTPQQKLQFYKLCGTVLLDEGVFLNGDLFDFQSPVLSDSAQRFEEDWIRESFDRTPPGFAALKADLRDDWDGMRDQWIDHLRTVNAPLPVEAGGKESETGLLSAAGFRQVGCPYRYLQTGLVWAMK